MAYSRDLADYHGLSLTHGLSQTIILYIDN